MQCCKESSTKYKRPTWPLPVLWLWPSFKVTSAYQTWLLFNLQYLGQYLSYCIQTWHDGRFMHGFERDIDFENVCNACFSCFLLYLLFSIPQAHPHTTSRPLSRPFSCCASFVNCEYGFPHNKKRFSHTDNSNFLPLSHCVSVSLSLTLCLSLVCFSRLSSSRLTGR